MTDSKLTALAQGTYPVTHYGVDKDGFSKKYAAFGIVNVKDFLAVGDGNADDTAKIQAAIDAAFGPWSNPDSVPFKRALYFPPGVYRVNPPPGSTKTVLGTAADGTTGEIILTLNNTTGLQNGDFVYGRGILGSGNANVSTQIKNVDSTHVTLVHAIWQAPWQAGPGQTICPPALRVKGVSGGLIYGAGNGVSSVVCTTPFCATITTNGWAQGEVRDISWSSDDGGIAFDLNGTGLAGETNTQSSKFFNTNFGGSGSTNGDYGCTIGMGKEMCSEIGFYSCFVGVGKKAGLAWFNQNALSGTVVGGNFSIGGNPSANAIGLWVNQGSCPVIHGIGFQLKDGIDIVIDDAKSDGYSISGCRSESTNFVKGPSVVDEMSINISGCGQTSPQPTNSGFFYRGGCQVVISACNGSSGHSVDAQNAGVTILNSTFLDTDYLSEGQFCNPNSLLVFPQPSRTITAAAYQIVGTNASHKLLFNNASPITVTVPQNDVAPNNILNLRGGNFIDVQQIGAGQVTFVGAAGVTIRSRGGALKLNGQWAVGRLVCDGINLWTLSGDITV
jgi:Pectate lyase superfamily protein